MGASPWNRLERTVVHQNPFRRFLVDRVRIQSGSEISYSWVDAAPAAFVVPLTADGRVILLRQYRYPIDRWVWEVPAGRIEGETVEETARRELLEEVGGLAARLTPLGSFFSAAAHLRLECHAFLASGVELAHPAEREATELMEVRDLSANEAFALARQGGDVEAQSALALLMAEPVIREQLR
ncbi:MAG: NUDIX hydrolase [Dehalococcoidia bacterium]